MQNKMAKIKEKGFVMNLAKDTDDRYEPTNFGKIRLGLQTLSDATVEYGELKKINAQYATKANVLKAINDNNVEEMRAMSEFFYKTSGIYKRLCRYMAYLYKYDWFITPYLEGCVGLLDTDSGISSTS